MKSAFIKTIFTGIFLLVSVMTSRCMAQQSDDALLKMMPEIPSEITEPSQRAEYLVLHFWDKFNFNDTLFLMADQLLERCFVEYLDLLSLVSEDTRDKSIHSLLKKSEEEKNFSFFLKLSERYLYEPDSPLYNEEKLIPFLQYAIHSSSLNDTEKLRPKYLLACVSKNRIGNLANDFTYTLMNGETGTLHAIKADYTLLYFNDPECEDCRRLIKQLTLSPVINQLIQSDKLKIITVYINDDTEAWEKHASDVVSTWIYAHDSEQIINREETYHIKQFPTLYLLNQDKKVLQKEITFETLETYFKAN